MIGAAIGWKFNHQAGMATKGGKITEFPNGIPSQADQDLWVAEYTAWKATMDQIETLEATITPRRMREAAAGVDAGWLLDVNTQIDTLRGSL
tara:strand:+ start:4463 stop:4738 length:276 start_codon:yes stop_codon:yes gene_type:complete